MPEHEAGSQCPESGFLINPLRRGICFSHQQVNGRNSLLSKNVGDFLHHFSGDALALMLGVNRIVMRIAFARGD